MSYKALIIDDDALITQVMDTVLSSRGAETHILNASDDIAFEIKSFAPDVILCDLTMPGKSGLEILKMTRDNADTANIPFIFMTAHEKADAEEMVRPHGAHPVLTKPIQKDSLVTAIDKALG